MPEEEGTERARLPDDPEGLLAVARGGDRLALARLISRLERGGAGSREVAALAYRQGVEPPTVGITGAPGAGKSTLVSRLIGLIREEVDALAVIAVDPTSPFSGGAILGDRIRMQDHALDPRVFIRSMATRGHLGGLALAVPEAVRILAAAGMQRILIETVGVGQVEVEVASATDTVVVVLTPGWGDAVQANKAGLLEIADVFVINKADRPGARQTRLDLEQMLDMSSPGPWRPPILETVASQDVGVGELWAAIKDHEESLATSGELARRRRERLDREFRRVLSAKVAEEVDRVCGLDQHAGLVGSVMSHETDPYEAAEILIAQVGSAPEAAPEAPPEAAPGAAGQAKET
ncbi:MAG: methylmalonyl Co-A mutase-associated GTPase MeaB [Acidimicrobiales bacterium]